MTGFSDRSQRARFRPAFTVFGAILPLAISPVPITAEILLLFTEKPKANAGAYDH